MCALFSSTFGQILPGYFTDGVSWFNMMIAMSYFSAIITLALWILSQANVPIIVYIALYGFGSGAFIALEPAIVMQISDVRQIGIRVGTYLAVLSIAALTGNPIGGVLAPTDPEGTFCGVVMLAGSTVFVLTRVYLAGASLRKAV